MQTTKIRHQFYLPVALAARLEALAAKPGASKTSILSDALSSWLDRHGAAEIDARFGPRFDRLAHAQERSEYKLDLLTETLGLFVQHQLTLVAHQPRFDASTTALGEALYDTFVDIVGRRMAVKRASSSPGPKLGRAK